MMTELLGKAETAAGKERARRHPGLARHSARLAAAVEVLFEVTEFGEELTLGQVWESIEAIVPRRLLAIAVTVDAAALVCSGLLSNAEHGAAAIAGDVTWFVFLVGLLAVIGLALATLGTATWRRRRHATTDPQGKSPRDPDSGPFGLLLLGPSALAT